MDPADDGDAEFETNDGNGTDGDIEFETNDGNGTDGDIEFETNDGNGEDGDENVDSATSSRSNTGTASMHSHDMGHTHPVKGHRHTVPDHRHTVPDHRHTVPDHYHKTQTPLMILADKITVAQNLATQDGLLIGMANAPLNPPEDKLVMPQPADVEYAQINPGQAFARWNITWVAGQAAPPESDPRYEIQMLGGQASGAAAGGPIASGEQAGLESHLLWKVEGVPATSFISLNLGSQFAAAIASGSFRWVSGGRGSVVSVEGALPTVVGAPSWNRVDESYAVIVNTPAGGLNQNITPDQARNLGLGVVPYSSQAPIGSVSTTSVAQVNWVVIRVRSYDANGNYLPSDWSDMIAAYGVHLQPGYEYRTK